MSARPVALPLSIVAAATAPFDDPAWLAALVREAGDVGGEIIVVGDVAAHVDGWRRLAAGVPLRAITTSADALTPELWGRGLAAAEGDVVGFTISQCTVQPGWARAALAGIAAGDAGVGGAIRLAPDASRTGRAIYYLRYSAFLDAGETARRPVRDIAGDNAAYRRDTLLRHAEGYAQHGFWEVEAHHHMRAAGETLALIPGMTATFGGAPALGPFVRHRFAHGAHFGAWRTEVGGRRPWQIALVSPLVPGVLLLRAARALSRASGGRGVGDLLGAGGPFVALATAWAAGEVAGALRGRLRRFPAQPIVGPRGQ